jgi:hypothetical protein
MGYEHRALKAECGHCKRQVAWSWKPPLKTPTTWLCQCRYRNFLTPPPKWPDLPLTLYIGHERNKRLRLHPIPPDISDAHWAQPYSIRSFLYQASRSLGGCHYMCGDRGTVMDERVFSDRCCQSWEADDESWAERAIHLECHIAGGWDKRPG